MTGYVGAVGVLIWTECFELLHVLGYKLFGVLLLTHPYLYIPSFSTLLHCVAQMSSIMLRKSESNQGVDCTQDENSFYWL